ncbi:DEAD/DEAH box helicase [Herbaspirillum sp. C9C3]|uniref:DEAD/DEAH box helicase n=1 Tax=Herbaspirillum sp. C9C3 TaxID=2735271 RepID=UPI001584858A|nr:DEAD/DEAH box helicase [Herbaspirillum sp. C9C3]NUT62803.1 DEAD/DEAH box helicase [Herbaspirillum sp. C9C3]
MANSYEELRANIELALDKEFRQKLLAKGQSRAMIWREGVLPEDAPRYAPRLSEDLLSFGYSLLLHAIRFIEAGGNTINEEKTVHDAFEVAAEAIEAVVVNGNDNVDRDFHRLVAASSYHIGRFSARAFSILTYERELGNLSIIENALSKLILRRLDSLNQDVNLWLSNEAVNDEALLAPLVAQQSMLFEEDESKRQEDALVEVIIRTLDDNFMKGMALFILALERGQPIFVEQALARLREGLSVANSENLVTQWWIHRLAIHLVDGLWNTSFHTRLPPPSSGGGNWEEMRTVFISSLYRRGKSEIELWPSQLEAASKAFYLDSNLVLSLPTSAGKTRIAELCILACLAGGKRVVFVTPLRALSAQTEVSLRKTFRPLGKEVSSLYGAIGAPLADINALRTKDIVVATPEKLDFALRSSPELLDDVGLIVLDEGHMIGMNEREVRYEAQIQRLLRRADAAQRRIVCLSAILPDGEQLEDFSAWLTADKDGGLVKYDWRPTRLRYGEIAWNSLTETAKLEITVGEPNPFVPKFILGKKPAKGRARKIFPSDQRELCIATAWRLMEEGQTVLIFCPLRKSVLPFATAIIKMVERGHIHSVLQVPLSELSTALLVGAEWFGKDHDILKCLKMGIAVHHGELPTQYRKEIERLLREGILRLTVSSPTLAQGLNLAATSLIFHGLYRNRVLLDVSEFKNVVGRAGRAYVDIEGLVLYPMFDNQQKRREDWKSLIDNKKSREMESGILNLLVYLLGRMWEKLGKPNVDVLLNYVMGQASWDCHVIDAERSEEEAKTWDGYLASLDTAIFSLLGDFEIADANVEGALEKVLTSSLLQRRLRRWEPDTAQVILGGIKARAKFIWSRSTPIQRKAYYLAGLGFSSGRKLDDASSMLEESLSGAADAMAEGDHEKAIDYIVQFSRIAFRIPPFIPDKLPTDWEISLRRWLNGESLAAGAAIGEDNEEAENLLDVSASLVESVFAYNLCWAMEAVRVRAGVYVDPFSELPQISFSSAAHVVTAVENGTLSISAALLMRAGFKSRLGAIAAIKSTGASFHNQKDMQSWLASPLVSDFSADENWPTVDSRALWLDFISIVSSDEAKTWGTIPYRVNAQWYGQPPPPGTHLVLGRSIGSHRAVCSM